MRLFQRRTLQLGLVAAFVVAALAALPVAATTIMNENTTVVTADETVDGNLYAFADLVRIEGRVTGDLVSGASSVIVAPGGVVEGDVLAGGREVRIQGTVDGDVRAGGFIVEVGDGGHVAGEFLGGGFSVGVAQNGSVDGDAYWGGFQGIADGDLGSDLHFGGQALGIDGHVAGDVKAAVGDSSAASSPTFWTGFQQDIEMPRMVQPGVHLGDEASIGGELDYTSPSPGDVKDSAVAGGVTFEKTAAPNAAPAQERNALVDWFVHFLTTYIALLIVGFIAIAILPRLVSRAGTLLGQEVAASAGWGLVAVAASFFGFMVTAILLVALSFLVGGLHLGALLPPLWSAGLLTLVALSFGVWLAAWVGWVATGLFVGRRLLGRDVAMETGFGDRLPSLAAGLAVVAILLTLPYLGLLAKLLLGIFGIGGLALAMRRSPTEPAPTSAAA